MTSARYGSLVAAVAVFALTIPAAAANAEPDEPAGAEAEGAAVAPKARARRGIEEIVVTAQKREQAVTDVPISMSVMEGEFIAEQGITDLSEAMRFVPNMQISPSSEGFGVDIATPTCRGLTVSGGNPAFEPPCGVALDGVSYTRPAYFSAGLFDLERVEVLRGPQGTVFGKNTTAGLIHLVSRDPTNELTGSVDVQYGELDRRRVEAAIGGPLVRSLLNFRAAGFSDDRDGYTRNTTAAVDPSAESRGGGRDRSGFRAKLGFPDVLGSQLKLAYESVRLKSIGTTQELFGTSPEVESYVRSYNPNADFDRRNHVVSIDGPNGSSVEIDTVQGDWTRDLFGWNVDVVGAYSMLEDAAERDADGTPVPGDVSALAGENSTMTFEVRTFSPEFAGLYGIDRLLGWSLGRSNVLAGIFYQRRKLENEIFFQVFTGPFGGLTAASGGTVGLGFPSLPAGIPSGGPATESLLTVFDQDSNTIAGFAQFEWYFAERWMLQYGMRLSNETKDGNWTQTTSDPAPVLTAAQIVDFTTTASVNEFDFQPKVTLRYDPLDSVALFAHWTRGFKGGGLNAFSFDGAPESLTYEKETVSEWAVDAKTKLLDGMVAFNVSLFRMDVTGFQVFTTIFDPVTNLNTGVLVENAGEARAQGIEADLTVYPTDWLTVLGTVGLNDTEFLKFPNNTCPADQENADGDDDSRCDVAGRPFAHSPEWGNTLTMQATWPLGRLLPVGEVARLGGVALTAGYTLEFVDVYLLNSTLDHRRRQPSFFRLKANVDIGNEEQGWSLRLTGENLTDERIQNEEVDYSPVVLNGSTAPPRLFFGQFRWEF